MGVPFYGDYNTTETVYIPFNTFSSDDPSASVTITNLAAGDVEIHKDGSTTQRASDNGVTVSIDFDSITGNHLVSIDLSDNSDAGYYANGSRYQVRMEGTTVDGATINAWIGSFSIGCTLRPTTSGRTLDVESGGCAGVDWANVANPTTAVDLSGTDIQLCDTVTTLTGHTVQTGDNYARLGAPAGASVSADIAAVKTETAAILVDTGTTLQAELDGIQADTEDLQTQIGTAGDGLTGIPWNAAWDAEVQSECADAINACTIADGDSLTNDTIRETLRWLKWFVTNQRKVDKTASPDELILFKDDDTTPGLTHQLTDDSNESTREKATEG